MGVGEVVSKRPGLCQHRETWVIGGGPAHCYEWCYACGAIRRLRVVSGNTLTTDTYWCRPVGQGGENPRGLRDLPKVVRQKQEVGRG